MVSQYFGARQKDNVDKTVNSALLLAGCVAVVITVLWLLLAKPLLTLMNTPANIFDDALAYFYIIIIGTVGHLYYQMTSSILRGMGDSVWPLGLLIFCSIFNIILDLLFVVVFNMGVCGAAWATILAQLISAIAVVWRLCGKRYNITVNFKTLKIQKALAKSILLIGIPAGLQQLVTSAGSSVVQVFTNSFGSDVVAANSTIIKVDGFIILPLMAIGTAITTYVGQNIGAGKHDRLKKGIRLSMWLSVAIARCIGPAPCGHSTLCGAAVYIRTCYCGNRYGRSADSGLFLYIYGADKLHYRNRPGGRRIQFPYGIRICKYRSAHFLFMAAGLPDRRFQRAVLCYDYWQWRQYAGTCPVL